MGVDEQHDGRYLDIDRKHPHHFNRRPFLFRHYLCDTRVPAFQPRESRQNASPSIVEYNAGKNSGQPSRPDKTPYTACLRGNGQANRGVQLWMVLKRAEATPRASRCSTVPGRDQPLSEPIEPACASAKPRFRDLTGVVTPITWTGDQFSAADPRSKTISVSGVGPRVLSEVELEKHFTGAAIRRNMVFHERYQERATVFELKAGRDPHSDDRPALDKEWRRRVDLVQQRLQTALPAARHDLQPERRIRKLGLRRRLTATACATR